MAHRGRKADKDEQEDEGRDSKSVSTLQGSHTADLGYDHEPWGAPRRLAPGG